MSHREDYSLRQIDLKWCCTAQFNQSTFNQFCLLRTLWMVLTSYIRAAAVRVNKYNIFNQSEINTSYHFYIQITATIWHECCIFREWTESFFSFSLPGLVSDVVRDWLRAWPGRCVNISHWGVLTCARADCGLTREPQIRRLGCVVNNADKHAKHAPDYSFGDFASKWFAA